MEGKPVLAVVALLINKKPFENIQKYLRADGTWSLSKQTGHFNKKGSPGRKKLLITYFALAKNVCKQS